MSSDQERNIPKDEFHEKLSEFTKKFVCLYEASLLERSENLEKGRGKEGYWANFFNRIINTGKDGTETVEEEAKSLSLLAINTIRKLSSSTGTYFNRKELKKLSNHLYMFLQDPKSAREALVESSINIFQCFECQFLQVTSDVGWQGAMKKLAEDAMDRVFDYLKKNPESQFSVTVITKGVILGESSKYTNISTGVRHLKSGHTIKYKNMELKTRKLYDKAGIVIVNSDGYPSKYYIRKDGKSDVTLYDYRLFFKWENKDKDKLHSEYKETNPPREKHKYILIKDKDKQKTYKQKLLQEINEEDPKLREERLRQIIKEGNVQIKAYTDEKLNELEDYVARNNATLTAFIENYQNEIRSTFESIKTSIDENKITSKQSNLEKYPEDHEKSKKHNIWFDLRKSIASFIGRDSTMKKIADDIKQDLVVISGLSGVGKTEMAIKFANIYYDRNKDNVIYINVERGKASITMLLKELGIKTIDQDGFDKSIELMAKQAYSHLSSFERTLFIFDNVEKSMKFDTILPPENYKFHIIIISTDHELLSKQQHNFVKLCLEPLSESEAINFVKDNVEDIDKSCIKRDQIKSFVESLDYLPLALQCAVAYINEIEILDCIESHEKYEQQKEQLYKATTLNKKSIYSIALNTIKKVENRLASDILNIMAYFSSDDIPKETFLPIARNSLNGNTSEGDSDNFAKNALTSAVKVLQRYSIINVKDKQGPLRIHRLIQQVIRIELGPTEKDILAIALKLSKKYLEGSNNSKNYTPHILSIWKYAHKYNDLIEEFIVKAIDEKPFFTTYFHLIAESDEDGVLTAILNNIENDKIESITNFKRKDEKTPLHCAVLSGNLDKVTILLKNKANINVIDKYHFKPLHLAAKNGYNEILKFIINENNIEAETNEKFTPLHLAARYGHFKVVKYLLRNGAIITKKTKKGFTPLHYAAWNNHANIVELLLNKIDDVNDKTYVTDEHKYTPLHCAAQCGCLESFNFLLAKGAKIDSLTAHCFTPLHFAAQHGYTDIVEILLDKSAAIYPDRIGDNAYVNDKTANGNTALHLAALNNHLDIVKVLINNNASINLENNKKKTVLQLATENHYLDIKKYIDSLLHS